MAVPAFTDRMIFRKLVPVFFLRRAENPGSAAKRAGVFERGQKSITDKLRPVRDALQRRYKRLTYLKCNNFSFILIHNISPSMFQPILQSIT